MKSQKKSRNPAGFVPVLRFYSCTPQNPVPAMWKNQDCEIRTQKEMVDCSSFSFRCYRATSAGSFPFLTLPGTRVVAATAGVIELLSPIDDNLVVSVGTCILLSLFPALL
jgi:hypothetical protein